MLKTLLELGNGILTLDGYDPFHPKNTAREFAKDVQKEVDEHYICRPTYTNGDPVHIGGRFFDNDTGIHKVTSIQTFGDGGFRLWDGDLSFDFPSDKSVEPAPSEDSLELLFLDVQDWADENLPSVIRYTGLCSIHAFLERRAKLKEKFG